MPIHSMCVVVRRPPYGREDAFAGLRMALSAVTHGLDAVVVLRGDGVLSAVRGQRPDAIAMPSNESVVADLLEMGAEVWAEDAALAKRGLSPGDLVEGVQVADAARLDGLILSRDTCTPLWGGF